MVCDLPTIADGGFVSKQALGMIEGLVCSPWYGSENARTMVLQRLDTFTSLSSNWNKLTFLDHAALAHLDPKAIVFIVEFVLNPLFEDAQQRGGMSLCFGMIFWFVTPFHLAAVKTDVFHAQLWRGYQAWRVDDFLWSTRHVQLFADLHSSVYNKLGEGHFKRLVCAFLPPKGKGICSTSPNSWIRSDRRASVKLKGKLLLNMSDCPKMIYIHKVKCVCKLISSLALQLILFCSRTGVCYC